VVEDDKAVDVGLAAAKQACRWGELILARPARPRVLATGSMKSCLLQEQGVTVEVGLVAMK
jgi:hypothetical protein